MKKRSLITGANDAKAYLLLHLIGSDREVILADSAHQKNIIPKETSASYAHELLTICLDKGINEVIPLKEQEITALAEAKVLFEEYGIHVLIPDLIQLKKIPWLDGDHFAHKTTVADFNDFSKNLLALGYPEGNFCFGDTLGTGNLILIDDASTYNPGIWKTTEVIPFIHIGKFISSNKFPAINIYRLEQPLIHAFDVFFDREIFITAQELNDELKYMVKNVLTENKLSGFYRVEVSGQKILRIRINMI